MAEILIPPAGGPPGRRRARRAKLESNLRAATTGRQVLAAAAEYFRSTFARESDETIERVTRAVIEFTDRQAGETGDHAAD